jgi:hypothetical protein
MCIVSKSLSQKSSVEDNTHFRPANQVEFEFFTNTTPTKNPTAKPLGKQSIIEPHNVLFDVREIWKNYTINH